MAQRGSVTRRSAIAMDPLAGLVGSLVDVDCDRLGVLLCAPHCQCASVGSPIAPRTLRCWREGRGDYPRSTASDHRTVWSDGRLGVTSVVGVQPADRPRLCVNPVYHQNRGLNVLSGHSQVISSEPLVGWPPKTSVPTAVVITMVADDGSTPVPLFRTSMSELACCDLLVDDESRLRQTAFPFAC